MSEGDEHSGSEYSESEKRRVLDVVHFDINFSDLKDMQEIGGGNFGKVFKANYFGTPVAVKLVFDIDDDFMQKYIEREMELLRALRHPNVVQFIGLSCSPAGNAYIVTEYIKGGDLRRILKEEDDYMGWKTRLKIALDVCLAMTYIHSKGLIHRDLKSNNLLVEDGWKIKVCDFGFSRPVDSEEYMTLCGTDEWMAPEVMLGEKYNEKADVFSYGMLLVELITHKKPPKRLPGKAFAFDVQYLKENAQKGCPPLFMDLALLCATWDPERRPKLIDILERLKKLYEEAPDDTDPPKKEKEQLNYMTFVEQPVEEEVKEVLIDEKVTKEIIKEQVKVKSPAKEEKKEERKEFKEEIKESKREIREVKEEKKDAKEEKKESKEEKKERRMSRDVKQEDKKERRLSKEVNREISIDSKKKTSTVVDEPKGKKLSRSASSSALEKTLKHPAKEKEREKEKEKEDLKPPPHSASMQQIAVSASPALSRSKSKKLERSVTSTGLRKEKEKEKEKEEKKLTMKVFAVKDLGKRATSEFRKLSLKKEPEPKKETLSKRSTLAEELKNATKTDKKKTPERKTTDRKDKDNKDKEANRTPTMKPKIQLDKTASKTQLSSTPEKDRQKQKEKEGVSSKEKEREISHRENPKEKEKEKDKEKEMMRREKRLSTPSVTLSRRIPVVLQFTEAEIDDFVLRMTKSGTGLISKDSLTFSAPNALDWAIKNKITETKEEGIVLFQNLVDRGVLVPYSSSGRTFADKSSLQYGLKIFDESDEERVLNLPKMWAKVPRPAIEVGNALIKSALELLPKFKNDIPNFRFSSDAYKKFCLGTAELQKVELESLSENDRLPFFTNLYNTLLIHSHIHFGPPQSLISKKSHHQYCSYLIKDQLFSLDILEQSLLNGKLVFDDFTMDLGMHAYILFALGDGTKSTPPFQIYNVSEMSVKLLKSASFFFKNIEFEANTKKIKLPSLCNRFIDLNIYEKESVMLTKLLPCFEEPVQDFIQSCEPDEIDVIYSETDWSPQYVAL